MRRTLLSCANSAGSTPERVAHQLAAGNELLHNAIQRSRNASDQVHEFERELARVRELGSPIQPVNQRCARGWWPRWGCPGRRCPRLAASPVQIGSNPEITQRAPTFSNVTRTVEAVVLGASFSTITD